MIEIVTCVSFYIALCNLINFESFYFCLYRFVKFIVIDYQNLFLISFSYTALIDFDNHKNFIVLFAKSNIISFDSIEIRKKVSYPTLSEFLV